MDRREFMQNTMIAAGVMAGGLGLMGTNALGETKHIKDSINSKVNIPNITLNNGVKMPLLGYGTYKIGKDIATRCTLEALEVGYRLIDTAELYKNEEEIGTGLKESAVPRKELFITTKLSHDMSYKETFKAVDLALKKLQVDYLDLLLIHMAFQDSVQMYKAMEELYHKGILKSIGISNFKAKKYTSFIKEVKITPMVNQMETHVFYMQRELRKVMKDTVLEAWSPFAQGRNGFFAKPVLESIARKHNKTVAQVGLRFLIQNNIVAIPKTTHKKRMIENIDIFDFSLDSEDMANIAKLETNKSLFGWY
ncbi:aldo/keto reductase [Helicobacter sp. 11S02629-2]|uniref:aldo/keto reductase n=1 Tax=Helicobacter sp. 11S02629-2 TaxID=1476195 RepID=UPI002150EF18|nr:aldo/keto reductase [Helicobacter sp. 11S02629-2]